MTENTPRGEEHSPSKIEGVEFFTSKKHELLAGKKHDEFRAGPSRTLILFAKESKLTPSARLRENSPILDEQNNCFAYVYTDIWVRKKVSLNRGAFIIDSNGLAREWPLMEDHFASFYGYKDFKKITEKAEEEFQKKQEIERKKLHMAIESLEEEDFDQILSLMSHISKEDRVDEYGRTHREKERDLEINTGLANTIRDLLLDAELKGATQSEQNAIGADFETNGGLRARIEDYQTKEGEIFIIEFEMTPAYSAPEVTPVKRFSLDSEDKILRVTNKRRVLREGNYETEYEPIRADFDLRATNEEQKFLLKTLGNLKPIMNL